MYSVINGRILSVILVLVFIISWGEGKTYKVGDGLSWVQPPTLNTYSLWAQTHVFLKGDILEFNFNNGIHNVGEVTKDDYKKCNKNSTIFIHNQSPVTILLPKSGKRYFFSTLNNDCLNGLKLAIKVLNHLPPSPPPSIAPTTSTQAPPHAAPISTPTLPRTAPTSNAPTSSLSRASLIGIISMLICAFIF